MKKNTISVLLIMLITGIALFNTACGNRLDEAEFLEALDTAVAATDEAQAAELQATKDAQAVFTPTETPAPTSTEYANTGADQHVNTWLWNF